MTVSGGYNTRYHKTLGYSFILVLLGGFHHLSCVQCKYQYLSVSAVIMGDRRQEDGSSFGGEKMVIAFSLRKKDTPLHF